MTRYVTPFFQPNRPLFIKVDGFQAAGKVWKRGEEFKWDLMEIPVDKIQSLYNQDFLHHNEELEEVVARSVKVGDGLEELSLVQLHTVVANINTKVKEKSTDNAKFLSRRCKISQHKEKQIGLIRGWRINYGHLE
jgi:hypothetical protein